MPLVCRPWGAGLVPFDNSIDALFSRISILMCLAVVLFLVVFFFKATLARLGSVRLLSSSFVMDLTFRWFLRVLQDNASSEEHVLYVWDHFVSRAEAKNVFIMAHSYGGLSFVELVSVFRFPLSLPPLRSLSRRRKTQRVHGSAVTKTFTCQYSAHPRLKFWGAQPRSHA